MRCNCRVKTKCPLNGDCRKEDVIWKCTALATFQPKKVYLGIAEGEFKKQRCYNHTQSFRNESYWNSKTLFSYVWKIKHTKKETPKLVQEIIRIAPSHWNRTKRCSLCLHEKLAILMYPNQSKLSNKRLELVLQCQFEKIDDNDLYSLMSSSQLT